MTFQVPCKTCHKCKKGFSGEGNICKYCLTGKERPKTQFKGFCYKSKANRSGK